MLKYSYYQELVKFYAGQRGVNPHTIVNLLSVVYNSLELLETNLDKKIK